MAEKILSGKVALVTGAGRGIGRSIAVHLAKAGADVAICDLNSADLDQVAEAIRSEGSAVQSSKTDVSNSSEVGKMVDQAIEKFGKIDILVNNAGILASTPVLEITESEWDKILDVNLKGTFLCTQKVLKGMIERKYGKIISLSSVDYLRGSTPPCLPYGTSKAAVTGFTKTLAREVGKHGINVNAVAPGIIETEMTADFLKERTAKYLADLPLGRIGKPEDVAKVVVFLASDGAAYVHGQTININGGLLGGMA